jgi:ATP-dependent Clp protease ATP-binding subunit ClpA
MFERFTDRARRVVVLAQEEARMLNHNYIGTEHILLGLIHEGEGVAAKALESLGISLEAVRQQVEEIIGQGQQAPSGHIPFTPRAKKVLELSLREALQLGHNYIGTEHILLGLIREGEGVAAQVLVTLGADLNRVREQVLQLLGDSESERAGEMEAGLVRLPGDVRLVGNPAQLAEIIARLNSVDARLAGIERHLGIAAERPAPAEEAGPGNEAPPEDEAPPETG